MAITSRSGEGPEGVLAVRADVTDAASVDAAFREVEEAHGPVEVLVANAGITHDQLLLRMSEEDFTSVVDTNLTGSFRVGISQTLMTKALARATAQETHGRAGFRQPGRTCCPSGVRLP